ncbi:MAG: zinc ribbon domain-containing protein [Ignavibacteria bacterium]|nr:zinc ribbon domain-containing protein [Ignavibacteria bacterium]
MPIYEYKCSECGFQFDKFQSIKDLPLKTCPRCGKESLKKIISGGTGLIFKGSGFYLTDYSKKTQSQKKEIKTDKKDKPKPPVKSESKNDINK